jgi:hypothetical protein
MRDSGLKEYRKSIKKMEESNKNGRTSHIFDDKFIDELNDKKVSETPSRIKS